jgi:hypothetical protein
VRFFPSILLSVALVLVSRPASSQGKSQTDGGMGPSGLTLSSLESKTADQGLASASTGQIKNSPAPANSGKEVVDRVGSALALNKLEWAFSGIKYTFHFGAGVSYLIALRLDDMGAGQVLLSDFSFSWAPLDLVGEIGLDVSIGRSEMFIVRPKLKFFFVKHPLISVYIDLGIGFLSHKRGGSLGGGAGLGLVFGIIENLALEVKTDACFYNFRAGTEEGLLETTDKTNQDVSALTFVPVLGLRLLARF